jgi:hypothetical protein
VDYKTDGGAIVLPAGSVPRIVLTGEVQRLKVLAYQDFEAFVEYPDGHRRFHQCGSVTDLLGKIAGQLKLRYNIQEFSFQAIPQGLTSGETIVIGEIKYA